MDPERVPAVRRAILRLVEAVAQLYADERQRSAICDLEHVGTRMMADVQVLICLPRCAVRHANGISPTVVSDVKRTVVRKRRPVGNQQRIAVRIADVAETGFAIHHESGVFSADNDAVVERHAAVPDVGIRLVTGVETRDRRRGATRHFKKVRGGCATD